MDIELNGVLHGNVILFQSTEGLCLPMEAFPELSTPSLPQKNVRTIDGVSCLAVDTLEGGHTRLDELSMRALVTLPTQLLKTQTLSGEHEQLPDVMSSTGFYTNYNLFYQREPDTYSYSSSADAHLFSPYGVLSSGYSYFGSDTEERGVRLDTLYVLDLPETIQSLRVGDVIGARTEWSGGLRIGGIQLARNFSTRPDMLTMPLPSYTSSATLPSAVDAYVNGNKIFQENVTPGPFEITALPTINGQGELTVVLKDITGVQRSMTIPFYSDTRLLRKGLSDYAFEAGYLRYNYGIKDFDYRDFVTSGSYRFGMTDRLTTEANALTFNERAGRMGAGASYLLFDAFTLDAAVAASIDEGQKGYLAKTGISRRTQRYSFSAQSQWATEAFLQPGILGNPLRQQTLLFAGYNTPALGSFSASYVYQKYSAEPASETASLSYSKTLYRRLFLNLMVSHTIAPHADTSGQLLLSLPLGERTTLSNTDFVSKESSEVRVSLQQNPPTSDGFGYTLSAARNTAYEHPWYGEARGSYQNRYARFGAGVASVNNKTAYRASAEGSFSYMEGHLHFNRSTDAAFGAVNVGSVKGVRVYYRNLLVGETDEDGYLFIPSLLPYQRNKITVDPRDIPFDYSLGRNEIHLTPYLHSGVSYAFDVKKVESVILHLFRAGGKAVPVGSEWVLDDGATGIVGQAGLIYFESLPRGEHTLRITSEQEPCRLRFRFDGALPNTLLSNLGEFTCDEDN
ncbi:fimbria/pilus outer membrane usher protein [Sulfurimonas sp. HSL-3221]|uniref:fimbria/pilus outer membrane usher protein n=1 Tax=Thiomicrolovo sulfuroxydans TaxID=2894755 RepID=UPI001E3F9750|nr:fimbria/pilus outer membrane usher protein [Sulfurimonas sp. HSL-3221]UFS62426.1 fimbria/pilus outer membrane usher protein [Sulfurimonas sp. HSL-3221]